ncbi:N-acetylneuraminate epimerase precursor [Caulifigura coniformis]|uniref:N-acetylneuraminate epimerase n=2 Tax=Caulifigura coniformis TaxID=2527983 RepID=A0A517S9C3_9PLAN|nr:N-acetylneuraminate epimerase precursor [Caulifigura coniformis]
MGQQTALKETGWSELPSIPDPLGVAGPFVGVSNERLIVAGGANFAEGKRPWAGGVKTWRDAIYVLDDAEGAWRTCMTTLPRPLGYGVSISTPEGLWCIGGSDANRHSAEVFLLQTDDQDVRVIAQPSLPMPLANSAGALVGSKIVVAGGIESPTSTQAVNKVFVLDTAAPPAARQWKTLAGRSGAGRMLATAGAQGNDFYLFGGVSLQADAKGAPERIKPFLKEAWRLRFEEDGGTTWKRLADLPAPRVACPTPAPLVTDSRLLVISGDDGSLSAAEEDRHPGFETTVFSYNIAKDEWRPEQPIVRWNGSDPATKPWDCVWPPVTTGSAFWQGLIVIPSGEIRPGVRTRRVLTAGSEILD